MVSDYAAIERGIDRSRILMGVVIPRDYSQQLGAGREAQVQILLDGSDSNTASIALGYAESLVRSYSLELRTAALNRRGGEHLAPPVDARMRVWYNSSLESKNYVVPGLIAVILQIIAALLTSLTIAREWEMGTMEQILSTPLRPAEMVLGKMLAYFVVGLADATICVLVGVFVFEVPFRGSLALLAVSTCMFLFGALFWGIFISAAARTQVAAYQMGILSSFLPAFLLSGFVYSIETMPWVIQVITHIVPARYVVTILKGVFLEGRGAERLVGRVGIPDALCAHRIPAGHAQAQPEAGVNAMWERIFVILRKEFIQALREPRMRVLLFVPPMVQLIVFGFAVNLDVDHARIAWMDMDRTPESRNLRDRFTGRDASTLCRRRRAKRTCSARWIAARRRRWCACCPASREISARGREHGSPGADRRHQFQHGVAGFELRGVDHRGVFGGRDGARSRRSRC